ncbi:MAG: DEAD/DEAH box helicase [Cetobacterium sp.]|nr:DEAD/DEAH box helicase [Cetobacterium sp.]
MIKNKFLSNTKNEKIIMNIREELLNCDEFIISVAFITESGLTLLLEQLKVLEEKNIKGKILTGDYLNFTEPKALERLLKYKNIQLKMIKNENFHGKGYFFKKKDRWNLIIGSSNLTQGALTKNLEWNLMVNSHKEEEVSKAILNEFNEIFYRLENLTLKDIEEYKENYIITKNYFKNTKMIKNNKKDIKPNLMQKKALENLENLRRNGKNKGLLISATGTGKTYLSAFHVKEVNPKKILFIAHRKTILNSAKKTFENIIKNKKMNIYDGKNEKEEYLFAMVQTLNKDEHLNNFSKDYFDYIVIDEVHHSGAKTYQKIIEYFKPKFFLGMTATPERNDDFDIYKLFDYNIAFEIRLHDALKENLLCPFHYFGIKDISIDGKILDEKANIKDLTLDKRVEHIIEKSNYYGYSGDKLHGLIFVSKKEEAQILTQKLNEKGISSKALLSDDSDEIREQAIKDLENGKLKFLLTVDIFNEGVDIPCINQVILLRPTESAIVYVQQIGRGLRKNKNKDYLVILDFIGNYERNFLIPVGISQNNSYDKDFLKRFLINGTNLIPGESSITFEKIVQEQIFENINKAIFSNRKNIEHDYKLLKKQLGRIPFLNDFFENNFIEPSVILKYKKTYDDILQLFEKKENLGNLNKNEKNYLEFLSVFFTPSKRIFEMDILSYFICNKYGKLENIHKFLENKYNKNLNIKYIENAIFHLSKEIFTSLSTMKKYPSFIAKNENGYFINEDFINSIENNDYFRKLIEDIIVYNKNYASKYYRESMEESIIKYKEYTKQEGFWYLNMDYNNGYQVGGYTIFHEEKKVLLFIGLEDSGEDFIYKNRLYSKNTFNWFSKKNRVLKRKGEYTKEGLIGENYYTLEVFMKKKSGENFFYMGQVEKVLEAIEHVDEKVIEYKLQLKYNIEKTLFEYLNIY